MLPAFGHVAELRRSGLQQRPDWQAVPLDLHRIGQSKLNSLPLWPARSSHLRASLYIWGSASRSRHGSASFAKIRQRITG